MRKFKKIIEYERRRGQLPIWSGYPAYDDIVAVNKIVCSVKNPIGHFAVSSHNHLAYLINKLRITVTIREFFSWYGDKQVEDPSHFDKIFKFLRACEHGLGEYYLLVEALINADGRQRADYSLFVAEMNNLFRPECVKVLDERGIPIQISERFYCPGDTIDTLSTRLVALARGGDTGMTRFEQEWVVEALSV